MPISRSRGGLGLLMSLTCTSGKSGLSFDSTFLFPLSLFCLVPAVATFSSLFCCYFWIKLSGLLFRHFLEIVLEMGFFLGMTLVFKRNLELSVLSFIAFFFFLLYPFSVLVCLCFPDEDMLLSKLLIVSCLFVRRRPLVSTFS